jgi:preprotein translocase subunit SecD
MWQRAWIVLLVSLVCGGARRGAMAAPVGTSDAIEITYGGALDRVVDDRAFELRLELEAKLADKKIAATIRLPAALGAITIVPGERDRRSDIEGLLGEYGDTLTPRSCDPDTGAGAICVQIAANHAKALREAALRRVASVVRARLDALQVSPVSVTTRSDQIVVVLPASDSPEIAMAAFLIRQPGRLNWQLVDEGSQYMTRLFQHVGSVGKDETPSDEQAARLGIHARVDAWREPAGVRRVDYYLKAADREESVPPAWASRHGCLGSKPPAEPGKTRCMVTGRTVIERYLFGDPELGVAGLVSSDPSFRVPDDRQIVFAPYRLDGSSGHRVWRTYYLERRVALSGALISNAVTGNEPSTHAAAVIVELDVSGTKLLAELTRRIVGRKLAFVLDDTIQQAPVLATPIVGGRLMIRMSDNSPEAIQEARALAILLKTGALPGPLREEAVRQLKR